MTKSQTAKKRAEVRLPQLRPHEKKDSMTCDTSRTQVTPQAPDETEETQPRSTCVFHSSPRMQILGSAALAAVVGIGSFALVVKLELSGLFGMLALLPCFGSFILLLRALRPRATVDVDERGLTIRQGKREKIFPWHVLVAEKTLSSEDMMGWKRLHLNAEISGKKVTATMDQIFGAGLPVDQIKAAVEYWIGRAKRSS